MTTAAIYLDPQTIHPVIDGEWHRTRLTEIPAPGQSITMLCGTTGTAAFTPLSERRNRQVPRQCPRCDAICQREHGIPPLQHRLGRR